MLFGRTLKPTVTLLGLLFEGEHSLHILKNVIEDPRSECPLDMSLVFTVELLVGSKVLLKIPPVSGMPVLAVDVEVLEHVIQVEIERLVDILPLSALGLSVEVYRVSNLVILSSPLFI